MSEDLSELSAKMRACTICKGLPLGPNPIFQLDAGARVLIVGQAPGRITHAKNRPFDDPSGVRLRDWLGVTAEVFYNDPRVGIFPMGLCFPGTGKGGDLPPRPECAEAWRAPVMQALRDVELTLVLGRYAIEWHLPHLKKQSVTQAVQLSAEGLNGTYVLPHPSPRNNRWLKQNDWFEAKVIPRIQHKVTQLLR